MKFTIERDTVKVEYKNSEFWQQFDEIEVENPNGWYLKYETCGIVHSFGYSQSSGRGEYIDEYVRETHKKPLHFTADAQKNAEIMHKIWCDDVYAMLIRE